MSQVQRHVLTDAASHHYVESFYLSDHDVDQADQVPWSVRKERLRGGPRDGVDLIEVVAGDLSVSVCPTRGMGIWRGGYQGWKLGWDAPVRGPVHPSLINLDELGGIGWLKGFDEWIVRCGLNNNGAPATDRLFDNTGAEQSMALPLHGRIANTPAHQVEVRIEPGPPLTIVIAGEVDESMLFFPQLRLATELRVEPGSRRMVLRDRVTNFRSVPAELELLYHCNFGPPLLEKGSTFAAPIERLAPINQIAAQALDGWDRYPEPTPGMIEQCYLMTLRADPKTSKTVAMLANSAGDKACAFRFSTRQMPCFTLWKNPVALSDGYVTGLEPGTDYPNAKPFERSQGRVLQLPPGTSHEIEMEIEVAGTANEVKSLRDEVLRLQGQAPFQIDREPPADLAGA